MSTTRHLVTDKELAVLRRIPVSDSEADTVDHPVWSLSARPAGMPGKVFAGVCGSLARKGLVLCDSHPLNGTIQMTQDGWDAMVRMPNTLRATGY